MIIRIAILLLLLALLLYVAGRAVRAAVRRRREARSPWDLREISEHDALNVYACKPGQTPQFLGGVGWAHPDFDQRIEDVRSDARLRVIAANSGDPEALTRRELST